MLMSVTRLKLFLYEYSHSTLVRKKSLFKKKFRGRRDNFSLHSVIKREGKTVSRS
jgi:hypothetical protein